MSNETPKTLGEINHTNPYTGEVFGETQTYSRGSLIAADGGEPNAVDVNDVASTDETLEDVSHTPPHDNDGTQAVYERGEVPVDE